MTRRRGLMAAIVATTPMAAVLVWDASHLRSFGVTTGDNALLNLATRSMLHGHQLLGAYSRYGWRHPGPALFAWMAPFSTLSDGDTGGLALAAVVLSILCLGAAIAILGALVGRRAAWLAAAATLLLEARFGLDALGDPWNPFVTVGPLVLLFVSLACLGHPRGRWLLPVAAACGTFVVQTHVGTTPIVLATTAAGLTLAIRDSRHDLRRWIGPGTAAIAVCVVAWAPVAYEQVTREPGNLGLVVSFFRDRVGPAPTLDTSLRATATAVTLGKPNLGDHLRNDLDTSLIESGWLGLSVLAAMSLVLLAGARGLLADDRRRARHLAAGPDRASPRVLASLDMVVLVGIVAAVVAGTQLEGPLYPYLLGYLGSLALVAWTAVAATIAVWVAGARPEWLDGLRRLAARRGARAVLVSAALVATLAVGHSSLERATDPAWHSGKKVAEARALLAQLSTSGAVGPRAAVHLSILTPDRWIVAAAIVDQLELRGHDVSVSDRSVFMFGADRALKGDESVWLYIAGPGGGASEVPPRATRVGAWGRTELFAAAAPRHSAASASASASAG